MVRERKFVLTLLVALGALGASFVIAYRLKSQSLQSSPRPFTAQGVVSHFAAEGGGGPVKVDQTTYARKSDGSWVEITTTESPNGEVANLVTFRDVASGRRVTLEPFTKSSMTYYLTTREMRAEVEGSQSCPPAVSSPTADHDRILGYDVVKVTEENPGPHKTRETIEAWVVPELGCYPLRRSELRSDGPHNEIEVTRLSEGEPHGRMFDVPAEYTERSPSGLSAEWAGRFGHKFWNNDSISKRMDNEYYAHRLKLGVIPK